MDRRYSLVTLSVGKPWGSSMRWTPASVGSEQRFVLLARQFHELCWILITASTPVRSRNCILAGSEVSDSHELHRVELVDLRVTGGQFPGPDPEEEQRVPVMSVPFTVLLLSHNSGYP